MKYKGNIPVEVSLMISDIKAGKLDAELRDDADVLQLLCSLGYCF